MNFGTDDFQSFSSVKKLGLLSGFVRQLFCKIKWIESCFLSQHELTFFRCKNGDKISMVSFMKKESAARPDSFCFYKLLTNRFPKLNFVSLQIQNMKKLSIIIRLNIVQDGYVFLF